MLYDLTDSLLQDYLCSDEGIEYTLRASAVSNWIHGRRPVRSHIVGYYCRRGNENRLAKTIAEQILPHMPDQAVAIEAIILLVRGDPTIHPSTKARLLEVMDDAPLLLARIIIYAMSRRDVYMTDAA